MLSVDATASPKATPPVVLKIRNLQCPTTRRRRPTLGRLIPGRMVWRMDLIVLLSALPLVSLAAYIGWNMATTAPSDAVAPVAIDIESIADRGTIEPLDAPQQWPELPGSPEIPADAVVPVEGKYQIPAGIVIPENGPCIADPNVQPSSAEIPMIGEIQVRRADYRRRDITAAKQDPPLIPVTAEQGVPSVRIRSVTPSTSSTQDGFLPRSN